MLRAALLHHRLPADAESHFDWLIEMREGADPDERALAAFRVSDSAAVLRGESFAATPIQDHRRTYLEFEGQLSGGRGHVTRIASGRVDEFRLSASAAAFLIDWGQGARAYTGRRDAKTKEWRFTGAPSR